MESILGRGVKFYQLPEALTKYIQEKGASGLGELLMVPLLFPVFVVNPVEYHTDVGFWHDRNPSTVCKHYIAAAKAPHTIEVRWTYTVPTGKKAMLEFAETQIFRDAAASTVGIASCDIAMLGDGVTCDMTLLRSMVHTNNVGDHMNNSTGGPILLLEGFKIFASTYDSSTGGTMKYKVNAKLTEFDA